MTKPHTLTVLITYRDDKTKTSTSTDFPSMGWDWVTLYDHLKRICIPAQGISRMEFDVTGDPPPAPPAVDRLCAEVITLLPSGSSWTSN